MVNVLRSYYLLRELPRGREGGVVVVVVVVAAPTETSPAPHTDSRVFPREV